MLSYIYAHATLGFLVLPLASTLPMTPASLDVRQTVNCSSDYDSSCWSSLNLSSYIDNWNRTTPSCIGSDNSACCEFEEPWSTCYLRLATGYHNNICTNVSDYRCFAQPPDSTNLDPSIAPEVQLVVYNIFSINHFFSSWYTALDSATLQTLLTIPQFVSEIDPKQTTNIFLEDILTALTVGLAFVGAPEAVDLVSTAASAFITGLKQAPAVAKAIWPSGTLDSQFVQLGNLETGLSDVYTNFTNAIEAALFTIMTDVPSFVGFASSGAFSSSNQLSVPSKSQELTLALRTFVTSTAMTANKWQVTPSDTMMTKADVASSASGSSGYGCTFDNDTNICHNPEYQTSTVFWSEVTGKAYELVLSGAGPSPYQLLNDIVTNQWSDLELLFDGAYNCTQEGHEGTTLNFDNGGTIDFSCVSQLKICVGQGPSCPAGKGGVGCQFSVCAS